MPDNVNVADKRKVIPEFFTLQKFGNDFSLAASAQSRFDKECNFRQSRRASAQGRFDKGCNRNLLPAVKLAAEVFLFDGGALVVDLLAFG